MDTLQLTLIVALIVMALINAASLMWAFVLDRKLRTKPVPKVYHVEVEGDKVFSEVDIAEVEKQALAELQDATRQAATKIQGAINGAVSRVAEHVDEMTTTTLSAEFEKYQLSLQALREQSITEFTKLQQELDNQRDQMIKKLEEQITQERSKRIDQFNARLNDVVSSYIAESLGEQVDLGSQMVSILQTLEKHKTDIKRDVLS
ncbi:MAG TPA: hypothetical protein VFT87_04680 [Candidatus Saccharimonadales bacterium]|nr:hypothetical protein [Candidatus Saccharimonadales bacterium]